MKKPLPYPYDASKVSVLVPRSSDGDFELAAVLSRVAIPDDDDGNLWPDIVDTVRAAYGEDAEVWARDDAPDILDGCDVTGDDDDPIEAAYLEREADPGFIPSERPKADPAFINRVRQIATKACRKRA